MPYTFSAATAADIPQVLALYASLVGTEGCTWSADYPGREEAEHDVETGSLYLLRDTAGVLAGAVSAGPDGELAHLPWDRQGLAELARLGVAPALHGRGVGALLLAHAMDALRARGFGGIRLMASLGNPKALALYRRAGFQPKGRAHMYGINFECYQLLF